MNRSEYVAFLETEIQKVKTGRCPNCNAALRPVHCCTCEGCDGCRDDLQSQLALAALDKTSLTNSYQELEEEYSKRVTENTALGEQLARRDRDWEAVVVALTIDIADTSVTAVLRGIEWYQQRVAELLDQLAQVTQERDRLRQSNKSMADELGHQDSYWDDPLRGSRKA